MPRLALALVAGLLALFAGTSAWAIDVERVTSPGGIEAWLVQDHTNPIIAVHFLIEGGAALDPADKAGLAAMAADLLDEGAGDLDSQAFHGKLEDLAIEMSFGADDDNVEGSLKTVTAHRDEAFALLGSALSRPRFDAEAVERIRGQVLTNLTETEQNPDSVAQRKLSALMFPGHPYGRDSQGTPETVKAITIDDLKGWAAARLARDRLKLAVVGDIAPAELGRLLDSTFGQLPAHAAPGQVAEARPTESGGLTVIRRPNPQSVGLFAAPGLKRDDPDWYAAYVMNYILGGGGFSSRLTTEVRVKRGLAYGVSTFLLPLAHGALIEGEVGTRNERAAESLEIIRREFARMAEKGVTPRELAEAKTYLNGSFPLQLDSTRSIAALLNVVQRDDLGIDYLDRRSALIDKVTAADVQRVARRLLDPSRLTFVVVGDPKGL